MTMWTRSPAGVLPCRVTGLRWRRKPGTLPRISSSPIIPSRSTSLIFATRATNALPVIAPGGRAGIERERPCGQVGLRVVVVAGAGVPRAKQIIRMRTVAASDFVASVRIVPRPPLLVRLRTIAREHRESTHWNDVDCGVAKLPPDESARHGFAIFSALAYESLFV